MTQEEKLYEVLGELLYAVAMADGVIQKEERDALNRLFENHEFETQVKWSFEYEAQKQTNLEDIYKKAISFCQGFGPSSIYIEFINAMKTIAKAADGFDPNEKAVIDSFSTDLINRFQIDADELIDNQN